ncbi:SDR family oxidoreductase [Synechococcus sp. HJ21-Hayes]|uniref:SDR family oxidoreductase n=1 Tax=unclassified Synechococcus TaxID=2626047 RepID=UPI0020CCC74F|nr:MULTISPECIES: SDR family oxidoreductase [unclassified Synechococcus]MCP9832419.1 SDR family oxidoreductase [Synechococcus sp. JJ3a-Johnson]MCP9854064.1 SDR family oxidoreductase [Synechococcus sp. HJ21-Hayes]
MHLAVSGASGKTGWRVVQEALGRGHRVTALVRPDSLVPEGLAGAEVVRLSLADAPALQQALQGCDALVIATGARPSIDLAAPLKVDAFGVRQQIRACQAVGVKRLVLVSSLCAGLWLHPLNLFGLILVWKRLGEQWLEQSGLDWTVIRPGGLKEAEDNLAAQQVTYSAADQQQEGSIPRRLVARVCLEALETPASSGRIVEITSSDRPLERPASSLAALL